MNLPKPYRHTQIGWVMLVACLLPALVLLPFGLLPGSAVVLVFVVAPFGLVAVLFASLTVVLDNSAIAWRFGIGLLRRRIEFVNVRAFGVVESPWYWGWGIRWFPGGKLYNVSGRYAVELVLLDQERVRIGTDEPIALALAIEARLGKSIPLGTLPPPPKPARLKMVVVGVVLVAILAAALFFVLRIQAQQPVVTVSPTAITIDSLFYGQSYPKGEIQRIALVDRLPHIRVRTNGYAAGGTLRGWFLLDELGAGKLFVEMRHPPFILVHLTKGFVAVNLNAPEQTERLMADLRSQFPDLAR